MAKRSAPATSRAPSPKRPPRRSRRGRPAAATVRLDTIVHYCLAHGCWNQLEVSLGQHAQHVGVDGGQLLHDALRRFVLRGPIPLMDPAMAEYRQHVERGLALAYGGLTLHEAVERLRLEVEHGPVLEAFERIEAAPEGGSH